MTDKQLTEAEAQEFLTLLEKVESDMDRAFSEASEQVFGEEDGDDSFKEQWGAPVSTVYVEETRRKLREFVEHTYLRDTPHGGRSEDETTVLDPQDEYTVEIADEIEDDMAKITREMELSDDKDEAPSELKELVGENADAGKPILRPPLDSDEIETIEDERHRALAWDLDAIATAYNYATDPLLPDLARDDAEAWIDGEEKDQLEEACSLLDNTYSHLYDRIGTELEQYEISEEGEGTD
ncbi:hypothetical protein C448_07729 [Halococcus morrhuae DSM 1307]|uniref:Uncharacterized protein n=1 Tax=Halococcus morrhuae DSM 1307 TaxID=931277 RepID=M0MHG1_HALMO|nr:hypothetical protein [Halococcus morrhuae]EMA45167.1 hypothetical protein C448_07729 [Halococcus morrhuae DSM 1307]